MEFHYDGRIVSATMEHFVFQSQISRTQWEMLTDVWSTAISSEKPPGSSSSTHPTNSSSNRSCVEMDGSPETKVPN